MSDALEVRGNVVPFRLPDNWETWPDWRKRQLRDQLRLASFRVTYRYEPGRFVRDCFDWSRIRDDGPTAYQEDALQRLVEHGRLAVRGPHGIGKSSIAAWVILWFSMTRDGIDDWKAPNTASKWRQLKEYLWPEVHKWARLLDWPKIGRPAFEEPRELQDLALRLETGSAFGAASNQPGAIEGAHADSILYVYDEAKEIPDDTFDASEGAFSGAGPETGREAYALALSTPGPPRGRFYAINRKEPGYEEWDVRHVKLEEAIEAGRIARGWVEAKEKQWGPHSAQFKNRVLGEFAADDENAVIPLTWIEQAIERWYEMSVPVVGSDEGPHIYKNHKIPEQLLPAFTNVAADIADQGEDETVLAIRHGLVLVEFRRFPYNPDPMESAGEIVKVLRGREFKGFACVEINGVGSGTYARLKEMKATSDLRHIKHMPFDAAGKSRATDRSGELEFHNLRAEAWWAMRELLDPSQPGGSEVVLPPDDYMLGDLTAPRKKQTSTGKILIEAKEDIHKRIGRSTDTGDACVISFWARHRPITTATAADVILPR